MRAKRLTDLDLFYRKDMEMVDEMSCPKKPILTAMHKRLELVDYCMKDMS